jgi:hypothetical protein
LSVTPKSLLETFLKKMPRLSHGSRLQAPKDSNVEELFGVAYDKYRFKFGEVHVQAYVFSGLSDSGRIRTTTNDSLRVKLTNNFYFNIGFWDNFDSPATAKKNELGLSSSIGCLFEEDSPWRSVAQTLTKCGNRIGAIDGAQSRLGKELMTPIGRTSEGSFAIASGKPF